MDVGVCGSIAPYNELIGGKLIAALMGSTEVRTLFKSRYNGKKYKFPSIIASSSKGKSVYRDANLMCLTTTAPSDSIISPPQHLIIALESFFLISLIRLAPCRSPEASPAII